MQPQTGHRAHPHPVRHRREHPAAHTADAVDSGAADGVVGTARMPVSVPPVRERERFAHRTQAGRELAHALAQLALPAPVVLALPRGGLPVALEVARSLHAPLDLLLVRKIGAPGQPELAVGAVAWVPVSAPGPRPVDSPEPSAVPATPASPAGPAPAPNERPVVAVLDAGLMAATAADQAYVERAVVREGAELRRRQQRYLQGRAPVSLHGRTAIVVDDGLATGTTVRAALKALRAGTAGQAPRAVVLAVPVAPAEVLAALAAEVDVTVCLWTPEPFIAVGAHYRAFPQVSDEEVVAALNQAAGAAPVPQA
jgi:putative phosphoribosyl transferase